MKPQYELKRIHEDGTSSEAEITPVNEVSWQLGQSRRRLFGSVLAAGAALVALAGPADGASTAEKNCKKKKGYKWDGKKKKCVKKSSGGSYTVSTCTCNKVCTCVPVYN